MEEETRKIKIPLEGGRLRGVLVLDSFVSQVRITIDDGKTINVELYEAKKFDKNVSIFKDGNAVFKCISTSKKTI